MICQILQHNHQNDQPPPAFDRSWWTQVVDTKTESNTQIYKQVRIIHIHQRTNHNRYSVPGLWLQCRLNNSLNYYYTIPQFYRDNSLQTREWSSHETPKSNLHHGTTNANDTDWPTDNNGSQHLSFQRFPVPSTCPQTRFVAAQGDNTKSPNLLAAPRIVNTWVVAKLLGQCYIGYWFMISIQCVN